MLPYSLVTLNPKSPVSLAREACSRLRRLLDIDPSLQDSGVSGLGFRVYRSGFRVRGSGFRARICGCFESLYMTAYWEYTSTKGDLINQQRNIPYGNFEQPYGFRFGAYGACVGFRVILTSIDLRFYLCASSVTRLYAPLNLASLVLLAVLLILLGAWCSVRKTGSPGSPQTIQKHRILF